MNKDKVFFRSGYMNAVYGDFDAIVFSLERETACVRYDTLVGTGLSGALMVPRLAEAINKNWLIVRKPGENSHSSYKVEGTLGKRWLFVDDCVDSGATYRYVCEQVKEICTKKEFRCTNAGIFTYQYGGNFRKK
jgi:orotate phosphoribosyltransferase-like protein